MNMMMTEVNPQKLEEVSRKFGKLMELAKSTDAPGEAENCVALAQKLLWESNLEESQLLSLNALEKRQKRTFVKDGVNVGPDKYAVNHSFNSRDWKSELLSVLADNFFCKLHNGWAETVTIVGETKSIDIVKSLYEYLEKQIRASRRVAFNEAVKNGRIAYANSYKNTLSQFAVHSFKNSFAIGAVASINRRLKEQQRENVEETDKSHATTVQEQGQPAIGYGSRLVVQIHNDLDEAFYEFFPELHPNAIALRKYKAEIEYQERMKQLNKEREEREARIAAGEEMPAPSKPAKEYKRRGRKPLYRNPLNSGAYYQGKAAGEKIQINPALKEGKSALNK